MGKPSVKLYRLFAHFLPKLVLLGPFSYKLSILGEGHQEMMLFKMRTTCFGSVADAGNAAKLY